MLILFDSNQKSPLSSGHADLQVLGRVSTLTEYDRARRPTFTVEPNLAVTRTDDDGLGRTVQTTDSAPATATARPPPARPPPGTAPP